MSNQARWDRVLRIVLGASAVTLVFLGPQTPWGWVGVVLLLTGFVGFCPLYALFGFSSGSRSKPPLAKSH